MVLQSDDYRKNDTFLPGRKLKLYCSTENSAEVNAGTCTIVHVQYRPVFLILSISFESERLIM